MAGKWILAVLIIGFAVGLTAVPLPSMAGAAGKNVLATTFPVYQIVANVTRGRDTVRVDRMLPGQLGCPHDYALTSRDMQKLAKADILVINGLGMEEFLGAPLKKANPKIIVIDSSAGIQDTLNYSDEHHDDSGHVHPGGEHGHHGEGHHHDGKNPHLFASPRMAARLSRNIAAGLSKADPDGAAVYSRNAEAYAAAMDRLAGEMQALGRRLKNNRIVQPHGVFDYLARDMGLKIVAVMQAHGQDPSAFEMTRLISTIRKERAGAIFTEPQYPEKIGKALSRETGVPAAVLDPAASGPENAPLAYYETVMRRNMKTLERILGVK